MMNESTHSSISSLRITGELKQGRVLTWADNTPVALPPARFGALVTLTLCRFTKTCGYATSRDFGIAGELLHQTIRRLRCDFDAMHPVGTGAHLVPCVGKEIYLLRIPTRAIVIDLELIELAPNYLPEATAQRLLKAFADCQHFVATMSAGRTYDNV